MLVVWRRSSVLRLLAFILIGAVGVLLRAPGGALVHGPLQVGVYADVSTNWAGYIYSAPGIDSVGGTWNVPQVTGGYGTSASSIWVGIGGSTTEDLIQAGTEQDVIAGQPVYYAWYETLPTPAQRVRLDVAPGDQITVRIAEVAPNQWSVVIANGTNGQMAQLTLFYVSSHSSAEWIVEAPTMLNNRTGARRQLPLANFGAVHFSGIAATQFGSAINPLAAVPVVMAERRTRLKLVDVSPISNAAFDALYVGSAVPVDSNPLPFETESAVLPR
jgi:hypothetical protein